MATSGEQAPTRDGPTDYLDPPRIHGPAWSHIAGVRRPLLDRRAAAGEVTCLAVSHRQDEARLRGASSMRRLSVNEDIRTPNEDLQRRAGEREEAVKIRYAREIAELQRKPELELANARAAAAEKYASTAKEHRRSCQQKNQEHAVTLAKIRLDTKLKKAAAIEQFEASKGAISQRYRARMNEHQPVIKWIAHYVDAHLSDLQTAIDHEHTELVEKCSIFVENASDEATKPKEEVPHGMPSHAREVVDVDLPAEHENLEQDHPSVRLAKSTDQNRDPEA